MKEKNFRRTMPQHIREVVYIKCGFSQFPTKKKKPKKTPTFSNFEKSNLFTY